MQNFPFEVSELTFNKLVSLFSRVTNILFLRMHMGIGYREVPTQCIREWVSKCCLCSFIKSDLNLCMLLMTNTTFLGVRLLLLPRLGLWPNLFYFYSAYVLDPKLTSLISNLQSSASNISYRFEVSATQWYPLFNDTLYGRDG